MQLRGPSLTTVFYIFSPFERLFVPNLKTNVRGRNLGSNEGAIEAVDEHLGPGRRLFNFEGIEGISEV